MQQEGYWNTPSTHVDNLMDCEIAMGKDVVNQGLFEVFLGTT